MIHKLFDSLFYILICKDITTFKYSHPYVPTFRYFVIWIFYIWFTKSKAFDSLFYILMQGYYNIQTSLSIRSNVQTFPYPFQCARILQYSNIFLLSRHSSFIRFNFQIFRYIQIFYIWFKNPNLFYCPDIPYPYVPIFKHFVIRYIYFISDSQNPNLSYCLIHNFQRLDISLYEYFISDS